MAWPLRWNAAQSEANLERIRPVLEEEFAAAGFRKGGRDLFSGNDGDGLQLGMRIDDMDGQFCAVGSDLIPYTYRGALRMTAERQVYTR